jgi:sec-independent protein translocase protein TatC
VDPDAFLKVLRVTGGLSTGMRIVFWSGLLLSVPVILVAVGRFVVPGLHRRERKAAAWIIGASAVLFAGGVAMGYHLTLPVALRLMFRVNRLLGITCDFVDLADYMSFVLRLLIVFGLAFELPVVIVALGSVGILSSAQLRESRRYVVVGIFVAAMLLTPPDPITQLLMGLPLIALYEACIWIVWLRERSR